MGAGTPENGSGRAVVTRDLRSLDTSMNANALVALERDDTADGSSIVRAIDTTTTTCVEARGGDVVFCPVIERTEDGNALARTGEDIPVMTTSVYSEHELRTALQAAGYESDHIESALSLRLEGERGRKAAHCAESRTRDHPAQIESRDSDVSEEEGDAAIATDGGRDENEGGVVDVSPCPGCGTPTAGETCGRARCEGADEIDEEPL